MMRTILILLSLTLTLSGFAQQNGSDSEKKLTEAEKYALKYPMPKDDFVGFYKGTISGTKRYPIGFASEIFAEVFLGPDGYRLKVLSAIMSRSDEFNVVDGLKAVDGKIALDGTGSLSLKGEITPQGIEAEGSYGKDKIKLSMKRLEVVSPTIGAVPPPNACVLDASQWVLKRDGSPSNWEWKDGVATVKCFYVDEKGKRRSSDVVSKAGFGALRMHIEFKMPPEYDIAVGQGRGNSGIFIGPYEVQVLESFGAPALFDQCGSIYRQTPPKVNACLPPDEWQTYDIEFSPAVYNGEQIVKYPVISVWLNGVRVQNAEEIFGDTSKFPQFRKSFVHPTNNLKIGLQDHGHPIQFRNIWVQSL